MALRPKVKVNVIEAVSLQTAAGPGVVAIMGTATWGPINELKTVTSFNQVLDTFKDDKTGTTSTISLIKGTDLLYRDGAGDVLCVRVDDGTADEAEFTFVSGVTSVINVKGKFKGTYGNNISVTITAVGGNRALQITDGLVLEIYDNNGAGFSTNAAIVAALNTTSELVTATEINPLLVSVVAQTFLIGGGDGETGLTSSVYTTAFDNVLTAQDFDMLVIPGGDALEALNSFHSTMVGKLNTRESAEDKFAIFVSGIAKDETIATAQARTASGKRLTVVAPNVKYTHRVDNDEIILNGTYLACSYVGGMASRDIEVSPTHKVLNVEGLSILVSTGREFYNNAEQEQLLTSRIVPITKIQGSLMASRGVTRETDTTGVFFEQNIVRIVDFVKSQIFVKLNPFIGNPNLGRIRSTIATAADGVLEQDKLEEIISAFQPTQVNEGVSPDTVVVNMTIKPTFAINFINVSLTLSSL